MKINVTQEQFAKIIEICPELKEQAKQDKREKNHTIRIISRKLFGYKGQKRTLLIAMLKSRMESFYESAFLQHLIEDYGNALNTKQDPARIWFFYRPQFVKDGIIAVE